MLGVDTGESEWKVSLDNYLFFFFSSRRRHTRCLSDWSPDVCSSDLIVVRLLTVTEAQERVLERVRTLPLEPVPIAEAAGRVLGEDARALVDLPPFESSAMDGFAVRAADLPGRLPVVEHIAAGRPATGPLGPGESMGIATGGVVPAGADAVVPVEYVVHHDNDIVVDEAPEPGANVRPRGGD